MFDDRYLLRVGATAATLTTHLLGVETRLATAPRLQLVRATWIRQL